MIDTTPTPDQLFLDNGGRALLAAAGIEDELTIAGFFSRKYPKIPNPDTPDDTGMGTPSSMVTATVVAWPGGMKLYLASKPDGAENIEGVTIERFLPTGRIYASLSEFSRLPRPLLVLTIGSSYRPHIANAQVTIDPDQVVISGKEQGILDMRRLSAIEAVRKAYNAPVRDLRDATIAFEAFLDEGTPLSAPKTVNLVRKIFKRADKPVEADEVKTFWQLVDSLPLAADPAWIAARGIEDDEMASAKQNGKEA